MADAASLSSVVLGVLAAAAAGYAAVTRSNLRCLLASTAASVLLSLVLLVEGYALLAGVHVSLAAGFLLIAGFLLPAAERYEQGERGLGYLGLGAGAAVALLAAAAFLHRGQEAAAGCSLEGYDWLPIVPLLAGLLAIRVVARELSSGRR